MVNSNKIVSFTCPNELYEQLENQAKRQDRSKAWILRKAFKEYHKGQGNE
ncbi:MAG: hypothetical protein CMI54_08600 [Parcubacteria group bacterium]|nr:hypothetical protein [Parcubacteria group bacterium]|tara:strand:- start:7047 stop:7196 length:150 start_codon:yes stop_codon:yes gene_type:complete